jgi:hypothetical protein
VGLEVCFLRRERRDSTELSLLIDSSELVEKPFSDGSDESDVRELGEALLEVLEERELLEERR